MTKWIRRICILIVFSVLLLNLTGIATAEDCQDPSGPGTPTSVGNAIIPPCWNSTDAPPTIVTSSDTIAAGGTITLWVDSGGLASPPYTWSVSGTGYTLSDTETEGDLETLTLSCTTGSCGDNYDVYCTVTVTDDCGTIISVNINNAEGEWKCTLLANQYCCVYDNNDFKQALGKPDDTEEGNCSGVCQFCTPDWFGRGSHGIEHVFGTLYMNGWGYFTSFGSIEYIVEGIPTYYACTAFISSGVPEDNTCCDLTGSGGEDCCGCELTGYSESDPVPSVLKTIIDSLGGTIDIRVKDSTFYDTPVTYKFCSVYDEDVSLGYASPPITDTSAALVRADGSCTYAVGNPGYFPILSVSKMEWSCPVE